MRVTHEVDETNAQQLKHYALDGPLLTYKMDGFDPSRVFIPTGDELRARLVHEFHDTPAGGHLGRKTTLAAISRVFFWPRMNEYIQKWVRSCETCQRVKPAPYSQSPLRPLPIATEFWRSVSMDFILGRPPDEQKCTGVLVLVNRFSKMVHFIQSPRTLRWRRPRRSFSISYSGITACQNPLFWTVNRVSRRLFGQSCFND